MSSAISDSHHALGDELVAYELAYQFDMLRFGQFAGECDFYLARELGIASLFGALDNVPQFRPVEYPIGRVVGREYLGVDDVGFVELEPFVLRRIV